GSGLAERTTPRLSGASQYNGSAVLVDDGCHAPHGNTALEAQRQEPTGVTQSATGDVPTRSVGTINRADAQRIVTVLLPAGAIHQHGRLGLALARHFGGNR